MSNINVDRKVRSLEGQQGLWLKIPAQIVRQIGLEEGDTFTWSAGQRSAMARTRKEEEDDG